MLCWGQVVSHESLTVPGRLALLYFADRKQNQTPRCCVDRGEAKVIQLSGWVGAVDTPGV